MCALYNAQCRPPDDGGPDIVRDSPHRVSSAAVSPPAPHPPPRADLLVYTCITGGYDDLQPLAGTEAGVRYVCVTDRPLASAGGWEVMPLPGHFDTPVLANRFVKMHPHVLFPEHRRSVYVDGNIAPKPGVKALAETTLESHDFALYSHPFRDCIYAEAVECARIGHDWVWSFARQAHRYRRAGLPKGSGLYECNILLRNHLAPKVVALMETWWNEFRDGVRRDQVSLPYLLWKQGVAPHSLGPSSIRTGNPLFSMRVDHKPGTWGRDARGRLNALLLPYLWIGR
jgi:hypothetical protein